MSKMIDVMDNVSMKKHAYNSDIQDEIAKTYFHAPSKKAQKKKPKWKSIFPWLIAVSAIIIAFFVVLSRSSVDIKVRLLGEMPSMPANKTEHVAENSLDKGLFLVEGGEPNRDIVKNAYFMGDAKTFSMVKPDELVLCNARGVGWANYTLELKEGLDLDKLDICYTAKGVKGDESLVIVIVDSNNRSYRLEKDLSSALKDTWHKYTINFSRIKKAVDLSDISKIKFEFGSLTAGNYPSAVMSLKNIYITKTRRLKWL